MKSKLNLSPYLIGSAIIWAAAIIGCAVILKEAFSEIGAVLTGAAAMHLIIWSSLAARLSSKKSQKSTHRSG